MTLAEELAKLSPAERASLLETLSTEQLEELQHCWAMWARPEQLPPPDNVLPDGKVWLYWLYLAGRGTGKTRSGSEFVRSEVCGTTPLGKGRCVRIAIIGETSKDVRDVIVEGDSGLLKCHPKAFRPVYKPSTASLHWPNGAVATLYNGTEPDQLRGPQCDLAWADELAKWRYAQEAWDMLMFGLRLGTRPRAMVTTTPRPIPILKALLKDPYTVVTRGRTQDNAENLAASFIQQVQERYGGTRLGRQELDGELVDDIPDALWRRSEIDEGRKRSKELPEMTRIVVAVDPAAKSATAQRTDEGAETGIITVGLGKDGHGYVLADDTTTGPPDQWGRAAVAAYHASSADIIVAEENNGGEMVSHVIRTVSNTAPVKLVRASRGKVARAEPIAALYTQRKMHHVGGFSALEDQMCQFTNVGDGGTERKDRVDALVWGVAELFPALVTRIREPWRDRWTGFRNAGWG